MEVQTRQRALLPKLVGREIIPTCVAVGERADVQASEEAVGIDCVGGW